MGRVIAFFVLALLAVFCRLEPGPSLWLVPLVAACCCEPGKDPCCGCVSYPLRYTLTISGVVDGPDCLICNETYNGTFVLTKIPGICVWESSPSVNLCGTFAPVWNLACVPSRGIWRVSTPDNGNVCVHYTKSIAAWSCLGDNTLDLQTDIGSDCVFSPPHPPTNTCTGWPTTATVVPI